tara:strand:- start:99 stop:755 length:657 start_codon:yes stop_codon:yes gene_type:complete
MKSTIYLNAGEEYPNEFDVFNTEYDVDELLPALKEKCDAMKTLGLKSYEFDSPSDLLDELAELDFDFEKFNNKVFSIEEYANYSKYQEELFWKIFENLDNNTEKKFGIRGLLIEYLCPDGLPADIDKKPDLLVYKSVYDPNFMEPLISFCEEILFGYHQDEESRFKIEISSSCYNDICEFVYLNFNIGRPRKLWKDIDIDTFILEYEGTYSYTNREFF